MHLYNEIFCVNLKQNVYLGTVYVYCSSLQMPVDQIVFGVLSYHLLWYTAQHVLSNIKITVLTVYLPFVM